MTSMSSHFAVRESSLPNAGLGLFAQVPIPADRRIGEYTGERLTRRQWQQLDDNQCMYIMELDRPREYIDGRHDKGGGLMSYINGARTKRQYRFVNCRPYQYAHRIFIKTTKPVSEGEELIMDYGDEYWV